MLGPAWACFTAFTYVRATELCSLGGAPGVGTYGRRNGVCMSESYESDCVACCERKLTLSASPVPTERGHTQCHTLPH